MGSGEIICIFTSEFLGSTVTIAESDNHYTLSFDMKNTLYHSEILDFDLNAMIKWEFAIISLVEGGVCNVGGRKTVLKIWSSDLRSVGNITIVHQYSVLFYFWVPRGLHSSIPLKLDGHAKCEWK